jgi:hypothetical protein
MIIKLIKAIKLHRKLRINQEIYCNRVVKRSQDIYFIPHHLRDYNANIPDCNGLDSHNRAVKKVESKLPWLYFIISDLFGGASSIKKQAKNNNLIK